MPYSVAIINPRQYTANSYSRDEVGQITGDKRAYIWHHQTSPDSYREVYNHTNLRGLEKVNGEMALIMTVYKMKRASNILGIEKLLEKLKSWKPDYKKASVFSQKQSILKLYNPFCILVITKAAKKQLAIQA